MQISKHVPSHHRLSVFNTSISETFPLLITFEQWVLELWYFTWVFLVTTQDLSMVTNIFDCVTLTLKFGLPWPSLKLQLWHSGLEHLPRKRKVGCSNPSHERPLSFKQVISDSSIAKRSAISVSVMGPQRWPLLMDASCHSRCMWHAKESSVSAEQ